MMYLFDNPSQSGLYIFDQIFYESVTGAPQFIGGLSASNVTSESFVVSFSLDKDCTAYAVLVEAGSTAPTPAQIKAGVDYGAVTLISSTSKAAAANTQEQFNFIDLSAYSGLQLTVYITAEDSEGNLQSQAQTRALIVTLNSINTAPTVSGNYSQQTVTISQNVTFNASVNFTSDDPLTYSISGISGATINTAGVVSWLSPQVEGLYTATVTATDTAGQSASAQLPFAVIDAPAPVAAPYNRTVEWLNVKAPDLVIGDTFVQTLTLKQGSPQENCNVLAAESIKSAIVTDDNSMVLSDVVSLSSSATGAAWVNGVLVVDLGEAVTAQAASEIKKLTYGKIEIEVVLNGDSFTWFAPVRLIPGYID